MKVSLDKLKSIVQRGLGPRGCRKVEEDSGKKAWHGSIFGRPINFSTGSHAPSKEGSYVAIDEEVTVVSLPIPPTSAPTQSSASSAPTLESSLVVEPRYPSPPAQADLLGFDETPYDYEEYIEMGPKVKLTTSTFSNKEMAEWLAPRLGGAKVLTVDEIFAKFFPQLLRVSGLHSFLYRVL